MFRFLLDILVNETAFVLRKGLKPEIESDAADSDSGGAENGSARTAECCQGAGECHILIACQGRHDC